MQTVKNDWTTLINKSIKGKKVLNYTREIFSDKYAKINYRYNPFGKTGFILTIPIIRYYRVCDTLKEAMDRASELSLEISNLNPDYRVVRELRDYVDIEIDKLFYEGTRIKSIKVRRVLYAPSDATERKEYLDTKATEIWLSDYYPNEAYDPDVHWRNVENLYNLPVFNTHEEAITAFSDELGLSGEYNGIIPIDKNGQMVYQSTDGSVNIIITALSVRFLGHVRSLDYRIDNSPYKLSMKNMDSPTIKELLCHESIVEILLHFGRDKIHYTKTVENNAIKYILLTYEDLLIYPNVYMHKDIPYTVYV